LNIYINRRDYSDAISTVGKVEELTRDKLQLGSRYERRRRQCLGDALLCHARLLFAHGHLPEAAEKYRAVIVNGEGLIQDKLSGPGLEAQLSRAQQELSEDLRQQRVDSREQDH
jgi:hypothetical protein